MKRAFRGLGAALATAVLTLGLSAAAQTDNFMSECQPDAKAPPAAQQKGLEAVIAAHGQCQ